MKDEKNKKDRSKDPTSTGNMDEGNNEATRILYSDSISTAAPGKNVRSKKK